MATLFFVGFLLAIFGGGALLRFIGRVFAAGFVLGVVATLFIAWQLAEWAMKNGILVVH